MKALPQFIKVTIFLYIQLVYLTQAATCSCGASLELLLSSAASHNLYRGYHYVKYQLPTGPICPSSHDLPWLSKPLVHPIYPATLANTHTNLPRLPPSPHRLLRPLVLPLYHHCVTLRLPPKHFAPQTTTV